MTRAAVYLRRSTDKQEKSIEDQRAEVERFAEREGYRIVRRYLDDGISGDATEKRRGFLDMRDDAAKDEFDVILCWDISRFGRFDSLDAGHWIKPIRDAGVRLVTCCDGAIDWNDFAGRLMYQIQTEGKHQFLRDLSKNVTRSQIANADRGFINGGKAPYGFDKMVVDENGNPVQRVPRTSGPVVKPRGCKTVLVPSEDDREIETVRWIFDTYANKDIGTRPIANQLNAKGVVGPGGEHWCHDNVAKILGNQAYAGTLVWGRSSVGKYHRASGPNVKARNAKGRRQNPREEWTVKEGAFEPIVDPETFRKVQDKRERRRRQTSPNGGFLLSGLLYCAHCGSTMIGTSARTRKLSGDVVKREYVCSRYQRRGSISGCHRFSIRQDRLLSLLIDKLRKNMMADLPFEDLVAKVRGRLEARERPEASRIEATRKRVAKLDRELKDGAKRLLRAPDDVADLLGVELSTTRRERDRLAKELAEMERPHTSVDLDLEAEMAAREFVEMAAEFDTDDEARLREILRRSIERVDIRFEPKPPTRKSTGKRIHFQVESGAVSLRHDVDSSLLYGPERDDLQESAKRRIIEFVEADLPKWHPRVRDCA